MKGRLAKAIKITGTIKIGPPLTIPDDALLDGISVIEESIEECLS